MSKTRYLGSSDFGKGTIQTPQILELSGIGNKNIVSKFGIKPLVDLPGVGENLRECTLHPL